MFSKLKAAIGKLVGGIAPQMPPASPPVEYKGYQIIAAPFPARDQFQTSGKIEKETPEGLKTHAFIRADTYANWDDAVAFTITKAKQIIDQQGDRMFT
jgi:hypothetical protein